MKRRFPVFLASVLLVLSVLTGCGSSQTTMAPGAGQAVVTMTEAASPGTKAAATTAAASQTRSEKDTSPAAAEKASSGKQGQKASASAESATAETTEELTLPEDGTYNSKEEVALYLHLYGHLPSNYISKKDAQNLGWSGGSLEPYAPGKSIGGSRFGNYEGLLPEKKGRQYYECDIDTAGQKKRGAKRIVWSGDGLIYYTEDHYESFELLYGEEILEENGKKEAGK